MGEIINGFELIDPLQNKDAGFSRWTFARRGDQVFFLKEFLDPVYPIDPVIGERQMKARIKACRVFEEKCARRYQTLNEASDGNAVRVEAFFRWGSHYYVAMERVEQAGLSVEAVAKLPYEERVNLCRIVAHSFMELHKRKIVHADVKDKNILIKNTMGTRLTAKIIDFDCSFVEDRPPESEDELSGDQIYFAPEACLFLCGEAGPEVLTTGLDVFALGILFHQYMTGELPGFDHSEYSYLHEAVLDGRPAVVSPSIDEPFRSIIGRMLACDVADRCTMEDVWDCLMPDAVRKKLADRREREQFGSRLYIPKELKEGGFVYADDLNLDL